MNNRLLLILVLLFSGKSFSYGYVPLPEDSLARWVMRYDYVDPGVCREIYYFDYRMIGDTTISGQLYKKLYSENLFMTFTQFGVPGCSHPLPNNYIAAFRQDTLTRKAYLVLPGQTNDTLLYDFSLYVGDTLLSIVNDFTLGCANYNVINRIDSVLVGGVYCQWQQFNNCVDGYVEGVGSLNDPFQSHMITEGSYNLVCLKRDTSVIYDQTAYGAFCNIFSGIYEKSELNFEVFPSPAKDYFELKFLHNDNAKSIKVFNSFGRRVYSESNLHGNQISTEFWDEGIYLINVITQSGSEYSRKLLVIK